MNDPSHTVGHYLSMVTLVASMLNWVPWLVAFVGSLLAAVWWGIAIYESRTVQEYLDKRRHSKHKH